MTTRAEQEAMDGSSGLVTLTLRDVAPLGTFTYEAPVSAAERGAAEVLRIQFQGGPIAEVGVNGCQIEDVLDVLIARLEGFQRSTFGCAENENALSKLKAAKGWLEQRTSARRAQGVEGTNEPHQAP